MLLSLNFIFLSLMAYLFCLYRAFRARPMGQYFYQSRHELNGSVELLQSQLQKWIDQSQHKLSWHTQQENLYIIEERTTATNYGYFYYFRPQNFASAPMKVDFALEAKLVPLNRGDKLDPFDLHQLEL